MTDQATPATEMTSTTSPQTSDNAAATPVEPNAAPVTPPEGDKPIDAPGEAPKEGDGQPQAVEYQPFTVAEGYEALPESADTWVKEFAKENGLKQDAAQKLVDKYFSINGEFASEHEQTRAAWVNETKADPDFGGEKLPATLGRVNDVIRQYGGSEEQRAKMLADFNASGLGDNPHLIRLLNNIALATANDSIAGTTGAAGAEPAPQSLSQKFYGGTMPR